ncbi:MAG: 3-phosphoshikimate 1-carboxyvinyltransferase [Caldicoprobacterales bacterium]
MVISVPHANRLQGTIHVPGDKSISHRGVIFGALAQGTTRLENFLMADDCINTIKIFRQMGIEIDIKGHNTVVVQGKGIYGLSAPKGQLDAGNSGTTARLLMGLLAGQDFDSILTGDDSLRKRPMDRVVIPLRQMGARLMGIENKEFLPITILGKGATLKSIDYTMPVASAQVKSSLILASMYADNSSHIHQPAISRDHTEIMLESFGGRIHTDGETITTYPQPELYGQDLLIPGDISSAAYFLTAALLVPDSEIILKNVGINPTRSGILDVYKAMGASINIERIYSGGKEPSADITVKSSSLKGTVIEGSLIPRLIDELPIIALAATQAEGTTIIKDAEELKVKESDRIDSTVGILKKIGANIESTPDGMIIQGPSPLFGTQLRPGSDHRMVMMATIAGLIAQGSTTIHDANWVNISYPDFFAQIEALRC